VESRLIKTKIELQFAHKFWLEVASNSIALWLWRKKSFVSLILGLFRISVFAAKCLRENRNFLLTLAVRVIKLFFIVARIPGKGRSPASIFSQVSCSRVEQLTVHVPSLSYNYTARTKILARDKWPSVLSSGKNAKEKKAFNSGPIFLFST